MRLLALGLVLASAALARADSCEPEELREPRAVQAALARSEEVARVATETATRYAALCRGSAYAFLLALPEGERSSDLAKKGYELADKARALCPGRVEAHYRYALALGIYLRENRLSGITRVSDLIAAAKRAVEIDERYDRGGPHRLLARLYSEAPRVVGPGDHDLAREHLARLLAIAGDDEENKLTAVRVHHEMGDDEKARAFLRTVNPARAPEGPRRLELESEKSSLVKTLCE
jgi:hypothetical protein